MDTEYGTVKYIGETSDLEQVYVYGISGIFVESAFIDERPYKSMIRITNSGRQYFLRNRHKIYIDELEELNII